MLSCIYEDRLFNSDDDGFSEIEKRLMGKAGKFTCPICSNELYYNSKGKRVSHFSHYPGTACAEPSLKAYDMDDELHDLAKTFFAVWVKNQFPDALLVRDKYFPKIRQITDVYFEYDDIRVALEVQFKHITPECLIERRQNYKSIGVKDIWFFVREDDFQPGSPYERHYYQSNNRELYYIDLASREFTYYKGLKNEGFDKACLSLTNYISGQCCLQEVKINEATGALVLPGWRELYADRLSNLRNKIHSDIRRRKSFRNDVLQRIEKRNEYKNRHPAPEEAEAVTEVRRKLAASKSKVKRPAQRKAIQDLEYSSLRYYNEGKRNYVEFITKDSKIQSRYEVLLQDEMKGMIFLTCRSADGKGYMIKVFEDRKVFTLEEWF